MAANKGTDKMFNMVCPRCKTRFNFAQSQVGGVVLCPKCEAKIGLVGDGKSDMELGIEKLLNKKK